MYMTFYMGYQMLFHYFLGHPITRLLGSKLDVIRPAISDKKRTELAQGS